MIELDQYKAKDSNLYFYYMPTKHVDYLNNEIVRGFRLGSTSKQAEYITFKVPRKTQEFQEDLFPPFHSGEESQNFESWAGGETKLPITRSFADVADDFFS